MRSILFCICWFTCVAASAQQQKKITTVELSDTITFAAVDRPGELYVVTKGNLIQRFDKDGKLQTLYKSKHHPTVFDPRDGSRLFAYFRDLQQYWIFNPSFDVTAAHTLDSSYAIEPWLMCSSGDHNLWVLDGSDNSIKKVDTKSGTVPVDISMNNTAQKENFVYMREYQNFLFILEKGKGILVYNAMGKLVKTITSTRPIRSFSFLGGELYFNEGDVVKMTDIFYGEIRESKIPAESFNTLMTDERTFSIYPTKFDVRSLPPSR